MNDRTATRLFSALSSKLRPAGASARAGLALLACAMGLLNVTQALGQPTCRPALTITEVRYSAMQLPKTERTWTAIVTAEPSSCLTSSGQFDIVFSIERESGPDFEVRQTFAWRSGAATISRAFWMDEAPAAYRIENIAPCACRK